jgi:6-phosphogluconolactonase
LASIKFKKIGDTATVVDEISRKLNDYLSRGHVLLLLSGGSAIALEIDILKCLTNKSRLTLTLNDERYVPVGHKDSNWQQLLESGLDKLDVDGLSVLHGRDFKTTAADFSRLLSQAHNQYDYIVVILGMGSDGHTSGILPQSPAIDAKGYAASYTATDYQRITNTFKFLRQADEAFVYAAGEAKQAQIDKLSQDIPLAEQPMQIIKQIPRVTFYNDYKGE